MWDSVHNNNEDNNNEKDGDGKKNLLQMLHFHPCTPNTP